METYSFTHFIERYGEAFTPSMRYSEAVDHGKWRTRLIGKVRELMGPVPDCVAPEYEIVETWRLDDHTRHLVHIRVSEISTLVAYLLVPRGIADGEKRPGILASHGHTSHGIDTICGVV